MNMPQGCMVRRLTRIERGSTIGRRELVGFPQASLRPLLRNHPAWSAQQDGKRSCANRKADSGGGGRRNGLLPLVALLLLLNLRLQHSLEELHDVEGPGVHVGEHCERIAAIQEHQ
jgi:hypothetical protein